MAVEPPIKASWFYVDESEKIKKNWFLYEYACKIYDHIKATQNIVLRKWKSQQSNKQTAEFCAYYAKRMRRNMYSSPVNVPEEYIITADEIIQDYCHGITGFEIDAIADIGEVAWLELIDSCNACSVNCLNEMHVKCEFFDRMERGGCFS